MKKKKNNRRNRKIWYYLTEKKKKYQNYRKPRIKKKIISCFILYIYIVYSIYT